MSSEDQLEQELAEATDGLMMMSESEYPFEVVHFDAAKEPTPEEIRRASGESESAPVSDGRTVEEFFRAAVSEADWMGDEERATAAKFRALVRLLKDRLADLKVYRVGDINQAVLIVGRGPKGKWLGLKTRVVET